MGGWRSRHEVLTEAMRSFAEVMVDASALPPAIAQRLQPIFQALRVTSRLSAPLLSRGRVIGVITVSRTSSSPSYCAEPHRRRAIL